MCEALFRKFDRNQDSVLDSDEVRAAVTELSTFVGTPVPSEEELMEAFLRTDKNQDARLTGREFEGFFELFLRSRLEVLQDQEVLREVRSRSRGKPTKAKPRPAAGAAMAAAATATVEVAPNKNYS